MTVLFMRRLVRSTKEKYTKKGRCAVEGTQRADCAAQSQGGQADEKMDDCKTVDNMNRTQDAARTMLHELKAAGYKSWKNLETGGGKSPV
jgi:hypothetical protein